MKTKWKKILLVMAAILVAISCSFVTLPTSEAFGVAGSSGGGSSHSSSGGGGSSHSSGGSGGSWGSSDDDEHYLPYGDVYDDVDGGNITGGNGGQIPIAIAVVIVALAIFGIKTFINRNNNRSNNNNNDSNNTYNIGGNNVQAADNVAYVPDTFDKSQLHPMNEISTVMPGFNAEKLNSHVSNLFVRMQNAWTAKNFAPMEPYFHSDLYAQYVTLLNGIIQKGQTNYVDNIEVLNTDCEGWYQTTDPETKITTDHVAVIIQARVTDWLEDDKTKQVVAGSKTNDKYFTYRYIMTQAHGQTAQQGETQNCPNCGGVVNVNQSAECPYCHTMIKSESFGWVIEAIQCTEQINT